MLPFKHLMAVGFAAVFFIAPQQTSQAQSVPSAQTPLQFYCSQQADARGLHGADRQLFRATCKRNGMQTTVPSSPRQPALATIPSSPRRPQSPSAPVQAASPQVPSTPVQAASPPQAAPLPKTAPTIGAIANQAPFGRRVALVIGNSAYKNVPQLPNPGSDATLIADVLKRTGFESVTIHINVGKDMLVGALRDFAKLAETADWAVVYYAGHGMEVGGVNYLIPVDARLASDRDVGFETVALDQVLNAAERASKLRVVVLDACRDNPFANQMKRTITMASRSVSRGLASVEPDAGTLVVFAAKDGETALDGDRGHSPFAAAFAHNLPTPGLEIRRLFDFVRDDVMDATGRRQQPFSYGSISGQQDFYFVAK
jgi:hypothetical protein